MFISDRLVYLQMQKTGSSHVTKVLRKFTRGSQSVKHEQMTDYERYKDRLIVSSVRNPWDWYVSLWAFGCRGGGGVHRYLTKLPMSEIHNAWRSGSASALSKASLRLVTRAGRRPDWQSLYSDPNNGENFRAWLKLLLGEEGKAMSKEDYSASPVKHVVGFMTFRFLALSTEYSRWNAIGRKARTFEEIAAFADASQIASRVMRMESLNSDLCEVLRSIGVSVTLDQLDAIAKTNTSVHRKYTDYYDDETYRLVAERDRFIIDRYGYQMF